MDNVAKKKESPLKKLKTRKEFLIIGGLLLVIIAVYLIGSQSEIFEKYLYQWG